MIELRPVDSVGEDSILLWLNGPELCKYNSHAVFPAIKQEPDANTLRLGVYNVNQYPNSMVGVVSLQKIDWLYRSAELAILIHTPGKGVGSQAGIKICRHGFDQMNLHRIYCGVHEKNIAMQKLALKLGMKEEGRSRQAFYKHGKYADIIHYGMLKEEFNYADLGIHQGQPLSD